MFDLLAATVEGLGSSPTRRCKWEGCELSALRLSCFCSAHVEAERRRLEEVAKSERREASRVALRQGWSDAWAPDYEATDAGKLPNQRALRAALTAAEDRGVFLYGPTGMGKTRSLYLRGLDYVRKRWELPLVWNAIELRHALVDAARRDDGGASRRALMRRLKTRPVVIIDDMGHMVASEAGQEAILEIVEARTSARLPLWLSSQFTLEELVARFRDRNTGQAIVRRIGQSCAIIDFSQTLL